MPALLTYRPPICLMVNCWTLLYGPRCSDSDAGAVAPRTTNTPSTPRTLAQRRRTPEPMDLHKSAGGCVSRKVEVATFFGTNKVSSTNMVFLCRQPNKDVNGPTKLGPHGCSE